MRRHTAILVAGFASAVAIVACSDEAPKGPGSIRVRSSAQSAEPVFFQYGIAIDNGTPRTVDAFATDSFIVSGLAHGDHTVSVTGLPNACTGSATQTVNLKGDDTARVSFAIACPRTTGDIKVTVTTTGSDLDPNGYFVTVGGAIAGFVSVNGSTSVQYLQTGTYIVGLTDVATNCTASTSQSAQVTVGGTTNVSFTVSCLPVTYVKLVGLAAGTDRDPDGAWISIDGGVVMQRSLTATQILRSSTGSHTWALSDVAPNCTLDGPASGSFNGVGGDTITINTAMTCTAIPQGTAGVSVTDPAGDTIAVTSKTLPQAHDILKVSTRNAPGWLMVVLHFGRAIISSADGAPGALYGAIDIDFDENAATGIPPISNSYGGSAQQGVDFTVDLFDTDSAAALAFRWQSSAAAIQHLLRYKIDADSITVYVPLAKLGNDDGNVTVTTVVGTADRATDVAPNIGVVTSHVPSGPIIAGLRLDAPERQAAGRKVTRVRTTGTWRR